MNINILIVDDIEANLFSLESLIDELAIEEKQEINVMKSLSGEEALKIAMNNPLDLIILDVQMPIINGFEVAKFLKSHKKTKDIPIIFLTAAFISQEFVKNGFEVGAIDYFIKPIEKPIFVNKIKLYITLAFKGKQLQESENQLKLLNTSLEQRVQEEVKKNQIKTQQLFAQSRLAQMGEMISMIAHQWRQPLSSISAIAGTLSLDVVMDEYKKDFFRERLDSISDLSQHLSSTIEDFRNFFKPDQKKVKVKLQDVLSKALAIMKTSCVNDRIELIEEYHDKEEQELHDSEMMQVILNILKNSQDHLIEKQTKDPFIKITTQDRTISICDNAGGIPEDILPKIFDPYFSTKSELNGTGLGLYMSKTIIEEHHNGKLTAVNTDDGVCFTVKFGIISAEQKIS